MDEPNETPERTKKLANENMNWNAEVDVGVTCNCGNRFFICSPDYILHCDKCGRAWFVTVQLWKISADAEVVCCNADCYWVGLKKDCKTLKHDTRLLCPICDEVVEFL